MATIAEGIADYLIGRGLATTKGGAAGNIFQSLATAETVPTEHIVVIRGGGLGADRTMCHRRIINAGITIFVREPDDRFAEGEELAQRVYDAMLDLTNTAINGRRYIGINPVGDISDESRDDQGRWEWTMRFIVKTDS